MDPLYGALHMVHFLQQQIILEQQVALALLIRGRRRRRRAYWVKPWLSTERRLMYGHYDRLMAELRVDDPSSFFNYLRMPPEMFDELLQRLSPRLTKADTNFRKALAPGWSWLQPSGTWHLEPNTLSYPMTSESRGTPSPTLFPKFVVLWWKRTEKRWYNVQQLLMNGKRFPVSLNKDETSLMRWLLLMESMWPSRNLQHLDLCITTIRVSSRSFCSPLWMHITNFFGLIVEAWGICLTHKYSMLLSWGSALKMEALASRMLILWSMTTETCRIFY